MLYLEQISHEHQESSHSLLKWIKFQNNFKIQDNFRTTRTPGNTTIWKISTSVSASRGMPVYFKMLRQGV